MLDVNYISVFKNQENNHSQEDNRLYFLLKALLGFSCISTVDLKLTFSVCWSMWVKIHLVLQGGLN